MYHLFRLPESLETELHRMPPDPADDFFPTLRNSLGRPEKLLNLLATMCGGERADAAPGARKIGAEKDIITTAGLRKPPPCIIRRLRRAPGFPYFTTETDGGRG